MRPVYLEMQAFGPYARTQTLDFRELGDRPLFLIHGPTGSGKSTILDAICFALYGETSGKERDGSQMRSDHSPDELKTKVVFEFSVGNDYYRIERTPKYEVLREDGERYRTISHAVQMWRRTASDDREEPLSSRVGDVAEQVERLLGLRADQFRQVVVLPQGRFRELLTASSNDREKIFSTLFQTHHYRLIQDRLKARARTIRDALDDQYRQQATVLQVAGVENLDSLNTRITGVEEAIAELTGQRDRQEGVVKTAQGTLEIARETDRTLREAREAREQMARLDNQQASIEEKRKTVERAGKAAELAEAEKNLNDRMKEAETSEAARDQLGQKVAEAQASVQQAEQEKQAAGESQPEIEGLRRKRDQLEGLRPRIEQLSTAETALTKAIEELASRQQALDDLNVEHERLSSELKTSQAQLQSAQLQAGQVSGLRAAVESAKQRAKRRRDFDTAESDLANAVETQDNAVTALEIAQERFNDAQKTFDVIDSAWRRGQAAVLAGQLEEEQPCPVCGSVHHPAPASSDDEIPDENQLEKHRQALETARNNRDKASNNRITADQKVESLNNRLEELRAEVEEVLNTPAGDLDQQVRDAEAKLQVATTESEKVEPLGTHVERLNGQVEQVSARITEAQSARDQARSAEVSARTSYDNALREVPEEYRSIEALDVAIGTTTQQLSDLTGRIEQAEKALSEASREHQRLAAERDSAAKEAEQDRVRADETAAEFARRRLGQGFADDDAYRAARLPKEQVDQLNTEIKQYDEQRAIARENLQRADKAAAGLEQPDLETLQSAVTTAEAERTRIGEELAGRNSELRNLKHALGQIEETVLKIAELNEQYKVAEYLSGVANGEAAYSTHRVSFERFVLSAFLDEVLTYATNRLYGMTNGRFRLLRKTEGGDRRRSTGLDLEIEDAYTGTARDVSTLSGGEGFLAALAMALGLSEVVQSRSGGIRLQTLFVDEGFGSLDPDALDRSLTALVDMHHGRLVGIISHVPELQERIDAKLSVEAGKNGSYARFAV
jgi:DNA repair protein SbcC/Rad50